MLTIPQSLANKAQISNHYRKILQKPLTGNFFFHTINYTVKLLEERKHNG